MLARGVVADVGVHGDDYAEGKARLVAEVGLPHLDLWRGGGAAGGRQRVGKEEGARVED